MIQNSYPNCKMSLIAIGFVTLITLIVAPTNFGRCFQSTALPIKRSKDQVSTWVPANKTKAINTAKLSQPVSEICLQDDTTGDTLRIDSITGSYSFTRCVNGFNISGTQTVTSRGCSLFLQQSLSDRRLNVQIDTCLKKGNATIQILSLGSTFTILDRDISNSKCNCPPPSGGTVEDFIVSPPDPDPAVAGEPFDPAILKAHPTPPEFRDETMFGLADKTFFVADATGTTPLIKITLQPRATHVISLRNNVPILVLASVNWMDGAGPVRLAVAKDGVELVSGTPFVSAPDRGTVSLRTEINTTSNITISITNNGNNPVRTLISVGVLATSSLR